MKRVLKPVMLVDMDGTLADYEGRLMADLNTMRGPGEPELTRDNIWKVVDENEHLAKRARYIKHLPGWWRSLDPIDVNFQIYNLAQDMGFHNVILTKGPKKHPTAWTEKLEWCQKYCGDDIDVHVGTDKSLVYGRVLFDDFPDYAEAWLEVRCRGLVIMPKTEVNKNFKHPNVVHWDGTNFAEVKHCLQVALDRKKRDPLNLAG